MIRRFISSLVAAFLFAGGAVAQTTVTGPNASTIGHPVTWNNTLGTVVTDTPVLGAVVGGTGVSNGAAHGVAVFEGTSPMAAATTGTPGAVLIDQGSGVDPQFRTMSGAVSMNQFGVVSLGSGVVTSVASGAGLTGGPITSTGTLSLDGSFLRGYLAGNTLSGGGSQILTVSAGVATSDDVTTLMKLTSNYTKTFSAWSVGSGNGGLDTGSIAANTWYHVFIIERTDTGVVDVLISTQVGTANGGSNPVLPTNYTKLRRIGSIRTDGTPNVLAFSQFGDEFVWAAAVGDVSVSNLGTTATLFTLSVPTGVKVNSLFRAQANGGTSNTQVLLTTPDENVGGPSSQLVESAVGATAGGQFNLRTNTSAQIRGVSSNPNATLQIGTYGWVDPRGRFN